MTATRIDGKAFAAKVRGLVGEHVAKLKADHDITPGLAVVLVGEDPASQVYVKSKGKMTVEVGMKSVEHRLDADVSETELLEMIRNLNNDPSIHGILVQLPLPDHLNSDLVINSIDPAKDVDGFHISNVGLLGTGWRSFCWATAVRLRLHIAARRTSRVSCVRRILSWQRSAALKWFLAIGLSRAQP